MEPMEIIWINDDSKEAIVKHDTTYLFQDGAMSIYDMGKSLLDVKEVLARIGRDDIVEELTENGIL